MKNTRDICSTLTKHKHIIMLTIAAAALVGYILPFDNMMGVADAAIKKKDDYKKARDDYKKKFDKKKEEVKISIRNTATQNSVQQAGIFGGGGGKGSSYDPFLGSNTAYQFSLQNQQFCSGISNCPNTQIVDFRPYTIFGG